MSAPSSAAASRCRPGAADAVQAEDRRRVEDDRHPVRDERLAGRVAGRHELPDHPRHRVRHPVRQVDARVAEPDARVRRGKRHQLPSLVVRRVVDDPWQRLGDHLDRPARPDVAERVGALVRRSQVGPLGRGPAVERDRGVRLQGVREDIEPRRRGDHRRQGPGVVRVDDAERRSQEAMGDAGLGMERPPVQDRDTGGLAARAGGGGHGDERSKRAGRRLALADRLVHVVEQGRRMRRQQVRGLGGVDDATRRPRPRTRRSALRRPPRRPPRTRCPWARPRRRRRCRPRPRIAGASGARCRPARARRSRGSVRSSTRRRPRSAT